MKRGRFISLLYGFNIGTIVEGIVVGSIKEVLWLPILIVSLTAISASIIIYPKLFKNNKT